LVTWCDVIVNVLTLLLTLIEHYNNLYGYFCLNHCTQSKL